MKDDHHHCHLPGGFWQHSEPVHDLSVHRSRQDQTDQNAPRKSDGLSDESDPPDESARHLKYPQSGYRPVPDWCDHRRIPGGKTGIGLLDYLFLAGFELRQFFIKNDKTGFLGSFYWPNQKFFPLIVCIIGH